MTITRRDFLIGAAAGGALGAAGLFALGQRRRARSAVFIARAPHYGVDFGRIVSEAMAELGVTEREVRGKRVLLKPNLVEVLPGARHVNTHPAVVLGAAEAFRRLGATEVIVGEGSGHERDAIRVLESSGYGDMLREARLPFVDLNNDGLWEVPNRGGASGLDPLYLPATLRDVDIVVSVAKMKTHHWAGVTLSMKNLFGLMPGIVYGWPKNRLHAAGIDRVIHDLAATVRPAFNIIDGVVGMEGDGPIMGTPKEAGMIVMGRNALAVDATSARLMGVSAESVQHLIAASRFGPLREKDIWQRGDTLRAAGESFLFLDTIPLHRSLETL